MAQEDVVEVVVDDEQLLRQLLIGDAGDELQDPLLHGSACPVELLPGEEVRQPRLLDPGRGRLYWTPGPGCTLEAERFPDWTSGCTEQLLGFYG